jgi:hypothetical protein
MAAVKLAFTWLGVRKTLAPEQRTTAARAFHADRELLSASKLILDTKNPAYRAVAAVRSEASGYWRTITLPFPESGVRLLPQNSLGLFASTMQTYRERLRQAFATELQRLTAHLAERLTGLHDGQPKVFRDSAVENLREFFEQFRRLNIRSSPELDALVEQAQQTISGIEPQTLRDSNRLRERSPRTSSRFRRPSGRCSSTGPAGTSSGAGVWEVPHDRAEHDGVGRGCWRRGQVHLRRGTGPAGTGKTPDHPGEPR